MVNLIEYSTRSSIGKISAGFDLRLHAHALLPPVQHQHHNFIAPLQMLAVDVLTERPIGRVGVGEGLARYIMLFPGSKPA